MKREARSASYLLRLRPSEKASLERRAREAGTTLAEACRRGAALWLTERESDPDGIAAATRDTLSGCA